MKLELYDLHCHSTCSDGVYTPYELIDKAIELGLSGIAITDHDNIDAYTKEFIGYAKDRSINLINGIEFSSIYEGVGGNKQPIHILGYNFDLNDRGILDLCILHKQRRRERFKKIITKLENGGVDISGIDAAYEDKDVIGRPHIAEFLVKKGFCKDIKEAFNKFIGDRAPYFVSSLVPSIEKTIDIIRQAKGKAIIAHPILIKGKRTLRRILDRYDFDGMECYYGNFQRDRIDYLLKICDEKELLVTGGSDYHGLKGSYVNLGSSFVTKERVKELLSRS